MEPGESGHGAVVHTDQVIAKSRRPQGDSAGTAETVDGQEQLRPVRLRQEASQLIQGLRAVLVQNCNHPFINRRLAVNRGWLINRTDGDIDCRGYHSVLLLVLFSLD